MSRIRAMKQRAKLAALPAVALILGGCATVSQDAGFAEVSQDVNERLDKQVTWYRGTEADQKTRQKLQDLLDDEVTAPEAVQIALLNNRDLQATYSELGIAQADLVEAGLLSNPIFTGIAQWPDGGGKPKWTFEISQSFLEIFYMPLRKRVAKAEFEAAKRRVTGEVLDLAGRTREAFYRYQANKQMQQMFETVVKATGTSLEASEALRDAGNVPKLDVDRQQALHQRARLQLREAELATQETRQRLNTLMGVWGKQTQWQVADRLPSLPDEPVSVENLARRAIENSLNLAAAKQQIIAAGEQLNVSETTALVPELELGVESEGESSSWETGPTLSAPLPIFDQGQARVGRAEAQLRQARQRYYALAVRIRSAVRTVRQRLLAARDRADYYQQKQLPLRSQIVRQTQKQFNAMQLGVFDLLRAYEQQIRTGGQSIAALRDYWLARAELRQILSGSLPEGAAPSASVQISGGAGDENQGGH